MEKKKDFPIIPDDPDIAAFEGKIKEKCYELQIKRNTLEDIRSKLQVGLLERHKLERALERLSREYEEVKIQLEVAIKAARRGESERSNNREILARQSVQLDAIMQDRNLLQDQIRELQVEKGNLQTQLDQSDEKVKSLLHLQETCKIKETHWRSYFDTLQNQTKSLEQIHIKLSEIAGAAISVSKKALFKITHQRSLFQDNLKEKNQLFNQVLSLSSELEQFKRIKHEQSAPLNHINNESSASHNGWENVQFEMETKIIENAKEIENLQTSLNKALATVLFLQKSEYSKEEKIKQLENDIEKLKDNSSQKRDKSQQYDLERED